MTHTASWYHCSVKPVKRSAGRYVVAAAAYRLGEKLHDDKTNLTHDYRRRKGVEMSFTLAPDSAPDWVQNPEKLWNAAENAEKRINSQTAREVELALPSAVSAEQREQIARDFAHHLVERYGVAVTVALHAPSGHGDDRNHHAHILMTTRRMEAEGLGAKTRILDDKKTGSAEVQHLREVAAALINAALADSGSGERVDHRSFKEQGIDQLPTEHLGATASEMERRGEASDRGDKNREIVAKNTEIAALMQEMAELDAEIAAITDQPKPPIEEGRAEAEGQNWLETFTVSDTTAEAPRHEPEPTEPPQATTWQDRITAERQPPTELAQPANEENRQAQSAFTDTVNLGYREQIAEQGEVKHKGLVQTWIERAAEIARDTIRRWIDRPDPDNDPEHTR